MPISPARPFVLRVCGSTGSHSRAVTFAFLDWILSRRVSLGQRIILFIADPYTHGLADLINRYAHARKYPVIASAAEWHGLAVIPGEDIRRQTRDFAERMAGEGARVRVLCKELPGGLAGFPRVVAVNPRDCRKATNVVDMPKGRFG